MASFDSQTFATIDVSQAMMWDPLVDQQLVGIYGQMFQSPTDFYNSLDVSSVTSPSSDGSSLVGTSRRTSKAITNERGAVSHKVERRREQNRQSQRAYRDRKEKHQRALEDQIAIWKQKHGELVKCYADQTEEVTKLKARIEDLISQVMSLRSDSTETWGRIGRSPLNCDLVPSYDKDSGFWSYDALDV